jgi:hypothetical protein
MAKSISVQPVTNDIFILSTRGDKCLAVFGRDGILKNFTYLDRERYLQPEGICFNHNGDLFISTEGKHEIPPRLYMMRKLQ